MKTIIPTTPNAKVVIGRSLPEIVVTTGTASQLKGHDLWSRLGMIGPPPTITPAYRLRDTSTTLPKLHGFRGFAS
jgi:hypothetical protein